MRGRFTTLLWSTPFRLALALVTLFSLVSLVSFAASYVVTARALDQAMRADLFQDMAGFRAAPNATALAALVVAEARDTDPTRTVLTYAARNGRTYGNSAIARDEDGYHLVSVEVGNPRLNGQYLALTDTLWGGRLTIARSRDEVEALRGVFWNIFALSLIPTFLVALSGALYLAARTAGQVRIIGQTLDRLTTGNLDARTGSRDRWARDLAGIGEKVDQMATAQQASVEVIKQVSSDIAHDLKTPLQRVAVHLDELGGLPRQSTAARNLLDKATQEVDGMASVFRSLLQIAQLETGTPRSRFRPVDLNELARTFHEIYEPTASEKGQFLTLQVPDDGACNVLGDQNLLGQALANLIENAMRHTPWDARILIKVLHEGGDVILCVDDDGPGVPEQERALVLRRLYRLDRSRTTPGNGLGLSLVASIAALHAAELTLSDNNPGLSVSMKFRAAAPD